MKLNINSVSARLYRWVYATNRMPDSLCPYFWKLALMWIVLVPYTLLSLPYIAISKLEDNRSFKSGDSFGEKPGVGFLMWVMLYLIGVMLFSISIFWVEFPKESFGQNMQILGTLLWIIAIGVGGYHFCKWAIQKYKDSKIKYDENGYRIWEPVKQKSDSVVVTFVKATYNKYCPKIEWFTNSTQTND